MKLSINNVGKSFGTTPVVTNVSLDVPQGSRTAIVGSSGCGKTTLLRLIAGFIKPDSGEISLGDRIIAAPGHSVPAHRRGIGYVAQDGALFPHLSVVANIGFGLPRAGRIERIGEVMKLASLDESLGARYPHQLSGGQQQRVALARALAPRPEVVLLDEPFSALDTGLRGQTRAAVITALERSGTTTVLVTHDQEEALSFGDGVAVMITGALPQSGSPETVFSDPVSADVAALLGCAVLLPAARKGSDVETPLGVLRVRHDHATGAASVAAMIRPAQVSLSDTHSHCSAAVTGLRQMGPTAVVSLVTEGSHPTAISLSVPTRQTQSLVVGAVIGLEVDGGAVLYPSSLS
ncbi:iron(III) transport system ATP-binding protein [Rhodoglobus vestalii]|uniref:ABC-type quaternary amine transporter n=1 Tax=Rhodoglobus vestalii TaxID=193384 RepID=A0A8H2K675_9MICO|nr:ABC transporter ATP-binding protein [Rhodoglobus vestalii]TQO19548.1 iron(III) transport system ATP-binding protein [Rhodoglobus vestalii]